MPVSIDSHFQQLLAMQVQRMKHEKCLMSMLRQLMISPNCESWKLIQVLIEEAERRKGLQAKKCENCMIEMMRKICSLTVLIYMYTFKMTRWTFFLDNVTWESLYRKIENNLDGLIMLRTWIISQPGSELVQDTLCLFSRNLPTILSTEYFVLENSDIGSLIDWITLFNTTTTTQFSSTCQLVTLIDEYKFSSWENHTKKGNFILKKVIEIAGESATISANIFLLIHSMHFDEYDFTYFCQLNAHFLIDLPEQQVCSFFLALTRGAIDREIVWLIQKVCQLLRTQSEFFVLRAVYERVILPVLARRGKYCRGVEEQVYAVCSYFIFGFLKNCDIGEEGIRCVVKGIEKVNNGKVREKWINLCIILCLRYPEYKDIFRQTLKEQLRGSTELSSIAAKDTLNDPDLVWQVTVANCRKHKKYLKESSKRRGIENRSNGTQ